MNNFPHPTCIEDGYFVFTLMPSLYCPLDCPHCYLSKEERASKKILSVENLKLTASKVVDYYKSRSISNGIIVCYWYGGEPTSMGTEYFVSAVESINEEFSQLNGFKVRHVVLSSLNTITAEWYPIIHEYCDGYMQTSYDGLMRGEGYLRKWKKKVKEVQAAGIDLATISVVNNTLLEDGPERTYDFLESMNIVETSWLPFMRNEQNILSNYGTFAPTMNKYSDFMIKMTEHYLSKNNFENIPQIGQFRFVLGQELLTKQSNIAGQTMFLMPNGDFTLPDYKDGFTEYSKVFGNILESSFEDVLTSQSRRDYLRRQVTKNNNPECLSCEYIDNCIMEFWKDNRKKDDCFGAKRYVSYVSSLPQSEKDKFGLPTLF